jgi:hypothetical protein
MAIPREEGHVKSKTSADRALGTSEIIASRYAPLFRNFSFKHSKNSDGPINIYIQADIAWSRRGIELVTYAPVRLVHSHGAHSTEATTP